MFFIVLSTVSLRIARKPHHLEIDIQQVIIFFVLMLGLYRCLNFRSVLPKSLKQYNVVVDALTKVGAHVLLVHHGFFLLLFEAIRHHSRCITQQLPFLSTFALYRISSNGSHR